MTHTKNVWKRTHSAQQATLTKLHQGNTNYQPHKEKALETKSSAFFNMCFVQSKTKG